MTKKKLIILTFVSHYLPGYKCGGPIRSISNAIGHLCYDFDFKVVTLDRDMADLVPYPNVAVGAWNKVGEAEVFYVSQNDVSIKALAQLIGRTPHDFLYLNSGFDPVFTLRVLFARFVGLLPRRGTVVAPRGVFSLGALGIKSIKKRVFIYVSRALGLFRNIIWHASSDFEKADIQKFFGNDIKVVVAPPLPAVSEVPWNQTCSNVKSKGSLKIVFISRISPMKNLMWAISMLSELTGRISLDIYGPIEDISYWNECQKVIARTPENVVINYRGQLPHDRVQQAFHEHDLFFFPTLGENYGHVILESLLAGCPVLLSDMTPWRGLAELGCGWDFSLEKPEAFRETLQSCVDMGPEEYGAFRDAARKHALGIVNDSAIVNANKFLFQTS